MIQSCPIIVKGQLVLSALLLMAERNGDDEQSALALNTRHAFILLYKAVKPNSSRNSAWHRLLPRFLGLFIREPLF